MKFKLFLLLVLVVSASVSNVLAQPPGAGTPAGAGDKNLGDDQVKMRSAELERVKRDAQIVEAANYAPINPKIAAQFSQVKDDYEAIQLLQAAIIKAYTTGKTINYSIIESSAAAINKRALRLDENLFAATKKEKVKTKKSDDEKEKVVPIRDLIVDLDNAIGDFVSSKIFGNIKIIEPDVAIKTRDDLFRVLSLSEKLSAEAQKMK